MSTINNAVQWAVGIANDNSHGYEWGGWGPGYDCGHLVIMAWENAGVHVRAAGASYTGNMCGTFMRCGFDDITSKVNLSTGAGMQPGDVLVNHEHHAAMYIGNGQIVQARSNLDGKAGDSSGQEIRTQAYYNYPWNCVLRYAAQADEPGHAPEPKTETKMCAVEVQKLKKGDTGKAVQAAQFVLIGRGYRCGTWGADGSFGAATHDAVQSFQRGNKLDVDGVIGPKTWAALLGGKSK